MKPSYYLLGLLLSLTLVSCTFFEKGPSGLTQEQKDARILLKRAIDYSGEGKYQSSYLVLRDAYERLSGIDDYEGQLKAMLNLYKISVITGKENSDSLFNKLQVLSQKENKYEVYLLDAKIFRAYSEKDLVQLNTIFQNIKSNPKLTEACVFCASSIILLGQNNSRDKSEFCGFILSNLPLLRQAYVKETLVNNETISNAYYAMAMHSVEQIDYTNSKKYADSALAVDGALDNAPGLADNFYMIGFSEFKLKNYLSAQANFSRANELYTIIENKDMGDISNFYSLLSELKNSENAKTKLKLTDLVKNSSNNKIKELSVKYSSDLK